MEKDNKNELASVSQALSVFIKDQKSWYLYKKSEKISKAFFLLTRHLADDNMLKNHMREKALNLMSAAQTLLSNIKPATDTAYGIVLEALSLISLSDTALASELQSERNHAVVVRELETFINELSTWARERAVSTYIPASLFDMSDIAAFKPEPQLETENFEVKGVQASGYFNNSNLNSNSSKSTKPRLQTQNKVIKDLPDIRKGGRQESIIQAIKAKGEVSIKDLVIVVKGCSEKTIQRELISLVNAGVLSKTGERRWSRYSVI